MNKWQMTRLDQCCDVISGATPCTSVKEYWDGDICWVTPKDLSELDGVYISDTPRKLTSAGLSSCAATVLPPGTVLFSSRAPIGHVAINTRPMATNQGFKSFVPKAGRIHAEFLAHWLRFNRAHLESLGNGATFKEVSKAIISRVKIPLPPFPEQSRIAEVLDRAESLRAKRRAALAQLDALSDAIFFDMFGDPLENSHGWQTSALPDVCKLYSGGTPSKSELSYWQGTLPWFSAKDLKKPDLFDSQDHISSEVPRSTSLKILPASTVVIVVRGMILAHTFPVSVLRIPATINQDLKALLPKIAIEPQFLATCLRAQRTFVLQQVSEAGHGTKRLDAEALREIRIILPPIALQQRFVRCIEMLERLKAAQSASLAELDALFASLQHRAFRGEL